MAEIPKILIMACSERKTRAVPAIPAYLRYDGPAWRLLRRSIARLDEARAPGPQYPFTGVLSAEHGFIIEAQPIPRYDRRLDAARAAEILGDARELEKLREIVGHGRVVFLGGGKLYRDTTRAALARIGFRGEIRAPVAPRGSGDLLHALRAFIEAPA